ncbi:hypothetical protein BGAL_0169g00140 [Botrytis galanthina]|uniref:Uncharacterized protein n=1 Tax=Botrytis galanthina TaxID=278940 RepID=A0A4S8QX97_9HELO|nr:hypothetical protein BGAL_0169g00140 [Botrytis galanthina]
MTTQSGKEPLRRGTPPHERRDHLTKSPDFSALSSTRDRISQKIKALKESRNDYEKKYGPITSRKLPSSEISGENPPPKELEERSNYGWGENKDLPTDSESVSQKVPNSEITGQDLLQKELKERSSYGWGETTYPPTDSESVSQKLPNSETTGQDLLQKELEERSNYGWGETTYPPTDSEFVSQKLPNSEISGQDPLQKELRKRSKYSWREIKDPPTNTLEGEESVHWLDALRAENLPRAEFWDRLRKIDLQPDPSYFEDLTQRKAGLDAEMQRRAERTAEILQKKEELAALRSRERPPRRLTEKPPRRARRAGDRNSSEDEYQAREREKSRIRRKYDEPSQLLDWTSLNVRDVNEGELWGSEDMEGWGKPPLEESQDPVIKAADAVEPTKASDSDRSKGYEDAGDWWKPFQRPPREPVATTVKDPVRVKSSTKSEKRAEGLGAGGKHIQSFAGGRLPFHNEPESPLDAAERLRNQLDANEEYKHKSRYKRPSAVIFQEPLDSNKQDKIKKSTPMTDKAVQNAPLPVSSAARNNLNPRSLGWVEILILIVIGISLGGMALKITGATSDKKDITGSLKWGLGKALE